VQGPPQWAEEAWQRTPPLGRPREAAAPAVWDRPVRPVSTAPGAGAGSTARPRHRGPEAGAARPRRRPAAAGWAPQQEAAVAWAPQQEAAVAWAPQ